jgi:hypothetical protein
MRSITPQKIIGSAVVAFVLAVGAFGTASAASAFFLSSGHSLIFDATVGSVDRNSFTVYTTSSSPITVYTSRSTVLNDHDGDRDRGRDVLNELDPGDAVKIIATRSGNKLTASVIDVETGVNGYGTAGTTVLLSNAKVVSKSISSFVVNSNGIDVTLNVNSSTRFFNTSFRQLRAGQTVVVIGEDTGSSTTGFVAQEVFK